jgi:D-alanyl-D-alanine carboxypeptidase (penicillin-binding protein 5/6)
MAVVSGNDACVAVAEYMSGSVEEFVRRMNAKARQLGMTSTTFKTPNGLPANGQLTTARDVAKLSVEYLKRFPDSLEIHSMQAYTYEKTSHHNANRLLGKCPGVDGLKTGFVCASGYNISATGKRENVRVLAVVLGAPTPYVRYVETGKLIEAAFRTRGLGVETLHLAQPIPVPRNHAKVRATGKTRSAASGTAVAKKTRPHKGKGSAEVCRGRDEDELVQPASRKGKSAGQDQIVSKKNGKKASVQKKTAAGSDSVKAGGKGTRPAVTKKAPAGGPSKTGSRSGQTPPDHSSAKKKNSSSAKSG